ncbi:MAG: hypothetical protein ACK4OE_04390 [Acidovorax sp.]|uniref:hypothetical protein n=1 Tax=Acidovorax sp. TaxID=1872122 RepID=UPI00391AA03F
MKKHRTFAGRLSRPVSLLALPEIANRVADLCAQHIDFAQTQSEPLWQIQVDALLSEMNRRTDWTLHQLAQSRIPGQHDPNERSFELLLQILARFADLQEGLGDAVTVDDRKAFFISANVAFMLMDEFFPHCVEGLKSINAQSPAEAADAQLEFLLALAEGRIV